MCEALIPPLPMDTHSTAHHQSSFITASGSQPPIPDQVADMISKRAVTEGGVIVKIILKLLATRLGTLLVCGFNSLDSSWPFVHKFSEISLDKREQILKRWSREIFWIPLKIVFLLVKVICFFVFFSRVDKNLDNPAYLAKGSEDGKEVERMDRADFFLPASSSIATPQMGLSKYTPKLKQ